ncbi:indole-3-glycerol-phosphate synthase TrpC, partial [bacterium]|nr:indole-3-glycerol-phosphate synthase TrpC [bacterium]
MAKETILDKIVARKFEEVASAKRQKSLLELQRAAETVAPRNSFL